MSSKSSQLLHLDPLAIALEKRRKSEQARDDAAQIQPPEPPEKPSEINSRPNMGSQPNMSWQLKKGVAGGPQSKQLILDNQPNMSSQPNMGQQLGEKSLNLLNSLPDVKGDIRISHRYSDHLCRLLKPDEQAVYWQLYRLSWGWGKETCFISNPKLSERSNVPLSSMKRAIAGLVGKGIIEKTGQSNGFGKEQGVEYRVSNMSSQPNMSCQPILDTIKEKLLKHTHTKENFRARPKKEPDQKENMLAARGVGVKSKFSLEECRRYAEHLQATGQGINNPGGFAMMVYRSGMADSLISDFLNPAHKPPSPEASECEVCRGSGFYYPSDPSQGVVKCKHEGLSEASAASPVEGAAERRLTDADVAEQAAVIGELLRSGYTVEQAERQFGSSVHADDWREILARVARAEDTS